MAKEGVAPKVRTIRQALQTSTLLFLTVPILHAQLTTASATTLQVTGHVVNAITGAPIPRALVNLNSRAVLTDSTGQFTFPQFTANSSGTIQAWARVSKPGYSSGLDPSEAMNQQPIADLTGTIELKLYPDAILSGTVTDLTNQPLPKVQIGIYRESGDEANRRPQPVGFALTNSHGQWRYAGGGGRYFVLVRYSRMDGEVVLPQRFPDASGSETSTTFSMQPGEERTVDLAVSTGPTWPVSFQGQDGATYRFTVHSAGGSFLVFAQSGRTPGEYHIDLPDGTFALHGMLQAGEQHLETDARVTVAGKPVSGLSLHFSETPLIPITVTADAPSTQVNGQTGYSSIPTAQNLNLTLESLGDLSEDGTGDLRPTAQPDKSFALRVPPGTYRLRGAGSGPWFVRSAGYGTTDLLTQPLVVANGAGGEVIRIVASSAFGQVQGRLRVSGTGAQGFLYFLPRDPSLTRLYVTQSAADGTYTYRLPAGSYTAVAFEHRFAGDLRDPETLGRLAGLGSTEVSSGGKSTLDLEVQHQEVVR